MVIRRAEEREIDELQTRCRRLVMQVERGMRDDVPARAVELARYIASEGERLKKHFREFSDLSTAYHYANEEGDPEGTYYKPPVVTDEEFEEAQRRVENARLEEREGTLDAIDELLDLMDERSQL